MAAVSSSLLGFFLSLSLTLLILYFERQTFNEKKTTNNLFRITLCLMLLLLSFTNERSILSPIKPAFTELFLLFDFPNESFLYGLVYLNFFVFFPSNFAYFLLRKMIQYWKLFVRWNDFEMLLLISIHDKKDFKSTFIEINRKSHFVF